MTKKQVSRSATGPKGTSTRSGMPLKAIKRLFAVLHARYGTKWESQVPQELLQVQMEQWQRILSKFEPKDIARGLDVWTDDWPPNVFEFEKACRPPPEGIAGILEEDRRRLAHKPIRSSKETARKNLDRLKSMIHGARLYTEDSQ